MQRALSEATVTARFSQEKRILPELRWLRSARAVQRLESPESEAPPLRAEEVSSKRFAYCGLQQCQVEAEWQRSGSGSTFNHF